MVVLASIHALMHAAMASESAFADTAAEYRRTVVNVTKCSSCAV